MSQTWLISSGKGGIGKTLAAAALGCNISRNGYSVCVLDACFGLRCLDMTLGMQNQVLYDISDLMSGSCELEEAMLPISGYPDLYLLSASQHIEEKPYSSEQLHALLMRLKRHVAYIFVDLPSGIDESTRRWFPLADHSILLTSPDDMTIRCTEQLSSAMRKAGLFQQYLLVDRVKEELVANGSCYTPQTISDTLDIPLLGYLPEDPVLSTAMISHSYLDVPPCSYLNAAHRVCSRMLGEQTDMPSFGVKKKHKNTRLSIQR